MQLNPGKVGRIDLQANTALPCFHIDVVDLDSYPLSGHGSCDIIAAVFFRDQGNEILSTRTAHPRGKGVEFRLRHLRDLAEGEVEFCSLHPVALPAASPGLDETIGITDCAAPLSQPWKRWSLGSSSSRPDYLEIPAKVAESGHWQASCRRVPNRLATTTVLCWRMARRLVDPVGRS
jgi:hypothetical protein